MCSRSLLPSFSIYLISGPFEYIPASCDVFGLSIFLFDMLVGSRHPILVTFAFHFVSESCDIHV